MAMHLERVGGRFVAATAVLLAVAGNAAFAQEHKTYRCKVADVVRWDDDGHLRPSTAAQATVIRDFLDGIIIDTLTGAVTYRDGRRFVLRVLQQGNSRSDYVLIPDVIQATAATNFIIRIRAWIEKPILLFANVETFASGPCEVVR
jgi:hypothetical protein